MLKSMVYGAHLYNLHFTFLATFPHNFSRENIPPDPKNVITMMSVIIDTELQIIVCWGREWVVAIGEEWFNWKMLVYRILKEGDVCVFADISVVSPFLHTVVTSVQPLHPTHYCSIGRKRKTIDRVADLIQNMFILHTWCHQSVGFIITKNDILFNLIYRKMFDIFKLTNTL